MSSFKVLEVIAFFLVILFFESCKNQELNEIDLALPVFQVSVSEITHNSAKLTWDGSSDPDNFVLTYTVKLNQKTIVENTKEHSILLIDLSELTDYAGEVIASDKFGNTMTKAFTFTTLKYFQKYISLFTLYDDFENGRGGASSIIESHDGNYMIVGTAVVSESGDRHFLLIKMDGSGSLLWKKFYSFDLVMSVSPSICLSNNGYILAGHHFVLKIDFEGNLIWDTKIESYDLEDQSAEISAVVEDTYGNIFTVGSRGSNAEEVIQEAVLNKLDGSGNILWEKAFKNKLRNVFEDVLIDNSGDLITLGYIGSEHSSIDFWVSKINSEGKMLWSKTYYDNKYAFPRQLIPTMDGNYAFAGFSWNYMNRSNRCIYKIDGNGNLIWSNSEEAGFDTVVSFAETSDGGFIMCGSNTYPVLSPLRIYRQSDTGESLWDKYYYEAGVSIDAKSIITTPDDGYLLAGGFYYDAGYVLVLKTDPDGNFLDDSE